MCNPFDLDSIKRAIHQAAADLAYRPGEARARMLAMHRQVSEHDVDLWARSFLHCLEERR